jgi:hypothetical protein
VPAASTFRVTSRPRMRVPWEPEISCNYWLQYWFYYRAIMVWFVSHFTLSLDHVISQTVSCLLFTAESWVQIQGSPFGICGRQSGTEIGFAPSTLGQHSTSAPESSSSGAGTWGPFVAIVPEDSFSYHYVNKLVNVHIAWQLWGICQDLAFVRWNTGRTLLIAW